MLRLANSNSEFVDLHHYCGNNKNTTYKLSSTPLHYKIIHVSLLIVVGLGCFTIGASGATIKPHSEFSTNYFATNDTLPDTINIEPKKTYELEPDSILSDSLPINQTELDSLNEEANNTSNSSFKAEVQYHGNDSIMIDNRNNKAYMWGEAWVKYQGIELKADYLEIDFAKNVVRAKGLPDSNGVIQNTPVFKEKGQEYKSAEMTYNFQTKKGLINKITTQENTGYIHGKTVKMASEDVFYIKDGQYTTCELDHPHYYIKSNKLKIINNDKIVTGPAYLVINDVPTFLAVPFGFFPNQDSRKSGIIIPTIGSTEAQGFNLTNGGYYFGISDQMDLELVGDIHSNGSWTAKSLFKYNQRYKRSGAFQFSYNNRKSGDPDSPDYTKQTSYFINWSHTQDPKAKPNSNFTAIVKLGSSNYYQNDIATDVNQYLRNEFSSNVTYTQKFGNSPFSLKINGSHNQNNVDSTVTFKVPELALNMSRIFPFKRKIKVGRDKWYEKIGMTYSSNFKNQLRTNFADLGSVDNLKNMQNGVKHQINTSTSVKAGKINFSPGINYGETWYFKKYNQQFAYDVIDTGDTPIYNDSIVMDTANGFYRFGDLNMNVSASTKLYGMFNFRGENLKAIRHTVTPTVSFTYKPDLSQLHPEYFGKVDIDTLGNTRDYTVFDGSVYGVPNGAESGRVGFEIQNILEMKNKKRNDTTDTFTNTKLIDAWNFNTTYNILADSQNWSPLTMRINARIGKNVVWTTNTAHDFYGLDKFTTTNENGVITETVKRSNQFHFNQTDGLLRLTRFETGLGLNFAGKSTASEEEQAAINEIYQPRDANNPYVTPQYFDFNIPWNVSINYKFTYSKPLDEAIIVNSLFFSGNINLTQGWKVGVTSSYDFDLEQLGLTQFKVVRDLHCWQINLEVIPFGPRKSFFVNINVKQGFLTDLKLTRRNAWFDN